MSLEPERVSAERGNVPKAANETAVDSIPRQVRENVRRHASYIGTDRVRQELRKKLKLETINPLRENCGFTIHRVHPALSFLEALQSGGERQGLPDGNIGSLYFIHQSLLEQLKVQMEERLIRLPEAALVQMLDQTVQYITVPALKAIPMYIIRLMKGSIKPTICRFLAMDNNSHVVQELPLLIRRQVWTASPKLFLESIAENCRAALKHSDKSVTDIRSAGSPVSALSDAIGQSEKLFEYFANHCAKQAILDNTDYCAIVQHVLMCLSSNKIKMYTKLHELALIIDQIKRERNGISESALDAILKIFKGLIHIQQSVGEFLGTNEKPKLAANRSMDMNGQAILASGRSKRRNQDLRRMSSTKRVRMQEGLGSGSTPSRGAGRRVKGRQRHLESDDDDDDDGEEEEEEEDEEEGIMEQVKYTM